MKIWNGFKKMNNNKGFSLVEMLVAFAIASIAGIAIYGLMSAGTVNFKRTGTDVGLQYEQQVVVNKLRDALIETTNALSYDDSTKTLLVYNQKDTGALVPGSLAHEYNYIVTKIYLKDNVLYQVSKEFTKIEDINVGDLDSLTSSILGEEVEDITFDISNVDKGTLMFEVKFSSDGKEMSSKQTVALRNVIIVDDDADEIFATSTISQNSFINHIEIFRNDVNVTGTTVNLEILDGTSTMYFPFEYKVIANEDSERTYTATWSIKDPSAGISVDPSTGIVKINGGDSSIENGQIYQLFATSIDDPDKYAVVNIEITAGGDYPESVVMCDGKEFTNQVGYREYKIYPIITYTSGEVLMDSTLCTWKIGGDALPDGCEFDPKTNKFVVTEAANGKTFTFQATVKKPDINGVRLVSNVLTLKVEGVPAYVAKQKLVLAGVDSIYNNRGTYTTVLASWTNSTTSNFTYHWEISPSGENWNPDVQKKNFDKNISYRNKTGFSIDGNKCTSDRQHSFVDINCDFSLDWTKSYTIKVSCYATDYKGQKYGIGSEADGNYEGPVELDVTFEPVKCVLKPVTSYRQNADKTYKFVADQKLRATRVFDSNANEYKADTSHFESSGATVREYEIALRGVLCDTNNNNGRVSVKPLDTPLLFNKYAANNSSNDKNRVPFDSNASGLYGYANYCYSGTVTGFYFKMNDDSFDKYFNAPEDEVKYVVVKFMATDNSGNNIECHYLTGSNYYSDSDLTLTSDYRFSVVYDKEKIKTDKDYVEIVE